MENVSGSKRMKSFTRYGWLAMVVLFVLPVVCGGQPRAADPGTPPAAAHPIAPPAAGGVPGVDPTGFPMPMYEWRDPNWQEPPGTLKVLQFDELPLFEVANHLRKEFKEEF